MSSSHVDRNLLFGILALQMDFISRDALIAAMHAWVLNKQKPLGEILLEQGALAPDTQIVLDALVKKHLELHRGDPERSLAAVGLPRATQRDLAQLADPDVKASLVRLATLAPLKPSQQTTLPVTEKAPADTRFEILRSHAWGGLGEVYVAQDREVNREVALKRLHERYADNADSRARFLREAAITGGLEHPGIVPVYGLGSSEDGRPYYAMRFIRGQTLKEAIKEFHAANAWTESQRRIELRQLLGRFIAVCNAVEYSHSRGVIHRDLKPSNIMLGKYGETLVVDWGLCKALGHLEPDNSASEYPLVPSSGSGSSETLPGSAIGTPAYMSPEQSEGRIDDLGPASDVYSLGATLYTILTGKEPFESTIVGVVLGKVQSGDFLPPRERNPSVPRALNAICLKAMSLLPKDRYPSCAALATDIEHWLADEPVTALKDPLSDRAVRWIKRHRVLAAAAAALMATVLVSLIIGTALLGRANSEIKAANLEIRNAVTEARKQRDDATKQRAEATAARDLAAESFRKARQAIDQFCTTVGETNLSEIPMFQAVRLRLLTEAKKYYEDFYRQHKDDRSIQAELAAAYLRLAQAHGEEEPMAAAVAGKSGFEIVKRLVGHQASLKDLGSLADGVVKGHAWRSPEDPTPLDRIGARVGLPMAKEGTEIWEKLVKQHPTASGLRRDLAGFYNARGVVERYCGQHKEALGSFQQAIDIWQKLVDKDPQNVNLRKDLASGYSNKSQVYRDQRNPQQAILWMQKCLDVYESLRKTGSDVVVQAGVQDDLADTFRALGDLHKMQGKFPKALEYYKKSDATYQELSRIYMTQHQTELSQLETAIRSLKEETRSPAASGK